MVDPFWHGPVYGITLTIITYCLSLAFHRKYRWIHPLFFTSCAIILFVLLTDTYEYYEIGGEWLSFMLGPATIALGVPLYKHVHLIRQKLKSILFGVTAGSITGILSSAAVMLLFQGSEELIYSMMPKSVTTPVSIEIARQLGGIPELTAVFTVLAGLFGSMFGPAFLSRIGINNRTAIGTAMGTASHGIGTARMVRESEWKGTISGLCMGLSAIVTSILMIPLYVWLG